MPVPVTVTATQGGSTANGILLRVKVLTGAAANQFGATALQCSITPAAHQVSITTTVAGSVVYGAITSGASTALTANADTTLFDNVSDGTNGECYGTLRGTVATGTPGAITLGASAPPQGGSVSLAEILPGVSMTMDEDPSSPSPVSSVSATSVTTASFTPPDGALLVAMVGADGGSGVTTMTVSGGGLNWTPLQEANASQTDYSGVWVAQAGPPDPADPVITATQGGSTAAGMAMRIYVLTAAAATQNGATANVAKSGTSAFTQSVTTIQTGSRVYGASSHTGSPSTDTAAALTTVVDTVADSANNERYITYKATSLTGTPGATTLGFTVSATAAGPMAMAEILTAAGTLTEDASAPPVASTTTATFVSCANFVPPPGSLIVVLIASDGGTGITTMGLSGGSLSFSELVKNNPSGGDYAGVWIAQVSGSGPVFLPQRRRANRALPTRRRMQVPQQQNNISSSQGAPVTTSALACSAAFPAPAVSTDSNVTTTAFNAASAFPALTINAGSGVALSALACSASFPAPAASAGSNIATAALSCPASFPAPGLHTDTSLTTAVVSGTISLPPPAVNAGSGVTTSALGGFVSFPVPSVQSGTSATITTAVLAGSVSFPGPAVNTGTRVTVSSLTVTASFPAGGVSAGAGIIAAVLPGSSAFPAAAANTGSGITAPSFAVSSSFSAPGVTAGGSASATPPAVICPAAFPAAAVSAGETATVLLLSCSASFPAPAVNAGAIASPAAFSASAAFSVPSPNAGQTAATAVLGASVSFSAVNVQAGVSVTPAALSCPVTFSARTVSAGQTAVPPLLSTAVAFPAATVQANASAAITSPALAVSASFPPPAVQGGASASVTVSALAGLASFPALAVNAGSGVTLAVLSETTAFPAPAVSTAANASATPPVLARTAAFAPPGITAGSKIVIPAVSCAAVFPLPGITSSLTQPKFIEQFLGGTAVLYEFSSYGGTVTALAASYGGSLLSSSALGGSVFQQAGFFSGITLPKPVPYMPAMQNLQAFEGNDTVFLIQITQLGDPLSLAGYVLKLYVKASQQTPDSQATVYTVGSGLTVNASTGGTFTFVLPHTATTTPGTQWWRVDITDSGGKTGTALYGNLYILPA